MPLTFFINYQVPRLLYACPSTYPVRATRDVTGSRVHDWRSSTHLQPPTSTTHTATATTAAIMHFRTAALLVNFHHLLPSP
mmetsp:Transcript_41508/g.107508  ORF Transcript_41508/g.107508 Transcript_41508/m.107508 type:complete len:81 (-) Transcript_41508:745-987(-)